MFSLHRNTSLQKSALMQGGIQLKGFASPVLELKAEKASIFTFLPTFCSDLQALENPLHYIITCKGKQRSGTDTRSVPKSMGGKETSPVLTPHCALDPTQGTAPFPTDGFSNARRHRQNALLGTHWPCWHPPGHPALAEGA